MNKPLEEYKFCSCCDADKENSEFHSNSSTKDGLANWCKACVSSYAKARHPLYSVFDNMNTRCSNPNTAYYSRYGGRGITVCEEWKDNKDNFIKWAKQNGYKKGLTIDRIDNNGNYEPDNCHFVTNKINLQNQDKSKWWFIEGARYDSSTDAAEAKVVSQSTIRRWCDGIIYNGKYFPPKENCYSELKYA